MKKQLIKLSFASKDEWEGVKKSLYEGENLKEGIVEFYELGHLQKPPEKEGEEWGLYDDYSVDIMVYEGYDYTELEDYLITAKEDYLHHIAGNEDMDVIIKKEK